MMTRTATLALLALALLVGGACAARPSAVPAGASAAGGAPTVVASRDALPLPAEKAGAAPPSLASDAALPIPVPAALAGDRALVLTASVALGAADPWAVADRAVASIRGFGGDVMSLSQSGAGDRRSASLTLRVPAARFDDALAALRALDADVISSSVDGKDVTDQFVDLEARLAAKRAEEQRYLALMARTETISDILKLDAALTQVRTQVEQLTGQLGSLTTRSRYATISVSVSPRSAPLPLPAADSWSPAASASRALAALVTALRAVAEVVIWTVVLGGIPLLLVLLALAVGGRRREPRASA